MLDKYFIHDLTKWVTTPNGSGGFTFGSPVGLKGRWEDSVEMFINEEGESIPSRAVVYLGVDINVGDYLFKGVSAASDPTTVSKAYRVRQFGSVPSLTGAESLRTARM